MHFLSTREWLFATRTHTRCQERTQFGQTLVGIMPGDKTISINNDRSVDYKFNAMAGAVILKPTELKDDS